jgi:hypothetical protein
MSTQVQAAAPSAYASLEQIVAAVAAGKLNVDTASALLQRSAPKALTAKVSKKGAVSLGGSPIGHAGLVRRAPTGARPQAGYGEE